MKIHEEVHEKRSLNVFIFLAKLVPIPICNRIAGDLTILLHIEFDKNPLHFSG